jgi:hypothetical protein
VTPLSCPRIQAGGMDLLAVVIAVAAFALLLALIEGLDRV